MVGSSNQRKAELGNKWNHFASLLKAVEGHSDSERSGTRGSTAPKSQLFHLNITWIFTTAYRQIGRSYVWFSGKQLTPTFVTVVGAPVCTWKANKNTSMSVTDVQTDRNWDEACFGFSSVWNVKISENSTFIINV